MEIPFGRFKSVSVAENQVVPGETDQRGGLRAGGDCGGSSGAGGGPSALRQGRAGEGEVDGRGMTSKFDSFFNVEMEDISLSRSLEAGRPTVDK